MPTRQAQVTIAKAERLNAVKRGDKMFNSIENELIIITKQTFDSFLATDIPSDLIALYMFYYYTAKWQATNQPKCTTYYTAKALKWTEARVRRAKKELISFGFIEDVQQKDNVSGKVTGCYIKLNYIMKESNIHPHDFPQCGTIHSVVNRETNA